MKTVVYANRIKAKVICVAWHPASENLLAFSTAEGRVSVNVIHNSNKHHSVPISIYFQVGILDVNKVTNFPVTMKPFTSEEVYKVTWGLITDKSNTTPHWALFASSKTKLVYFPDKDKGKLCSDSPIPSN